ncbi:MAG TPA: hypothetical protein VFT72_16280 [Opitutaceae bacterium]|nr:hypothetical protein [Opitutaceae bacterium]
MNAPKRRLLLVSLLANVAAGTWLLLHPADRSRAVAAPSVAANTPTGLPDSGKRGAASTLDSPITRGTWAALQKGSDREFAEHLRTEGFPPEIVRALLRERVRARFKDRLDVLQVDAKDEYWRNGLNPPRDSNLSVQARAERRAIYREIDAAVKSAMGADFDAASPSELAVRRRAYDYLSQEKIDQVTEIERDYSDLYQQIREAAGPIRLQSDREKLRLLEREMHADLAAILTPEELLEYNFRNGASANSVSYRLRLFNPTEQEFRALTQIQLEFDREYGTQGWNAAELARRREAETALDAKMMAALSPERAAEYQRVTDKNYQKTANFLDQYSYPPNIAGDIVDLQKSVTTRAESIRHNTSYSADVRRTELEGLYREASATLSAKLSPAALEAYKRGAGRWLQQLQPKPAPTNQRPAR